MGALRVIGGGLFLPDVCLVVMAGGGSEVIVTRGSGVDLSWRDLKLRFLRIGVELDMTTEKKDVIEERERGGETKRDVNETVV